jgi:hypothetical protein
MRPLFCLPHLLVLLFSSAVRADPVVITTGVTTFTDEPGALTSAAQVGSRLPAS